MILKRPHQPASLPTLVVYYGELLSFGGSLNDFGQGLWTPKFEVGRLVLFSLFSISSVKIP